MGRKYQGFGLREVETEKGIWFKRVVKENFSVVFKSMAIVLQMPSKLCAIR